MINMSKNKSNKKNKKNKETRNSIFQGIVKATASYLTERFLSMF